MRGPLRDSPEMLRAIRTPGPPLLSPRQELIGCWPLPLTIGQRAHQADVRGGKGIGLAQLTQGNVLRRPFTDPAYRAKPLNCFVEAAVCTEEIRIGDDRGSDSRKRGGPAPGHAEGCEIRDGQHLWSWEDVGQVAIRRRHRVAMRGNQTPGKADGGDDRNLLPEHRANRQLETVPSPGYAQARAPRDQRGQYRVCCDMAGDSKWVRRQVGDATRPRDD